MSCTRVCFTSTGVCAGVRVCGRAGVRACGRAGVLVVCVYECKSGCMRGRQGYIDKVNKRKAITMCILFLGVSKNSVH